MIEFLSKLVQARLKCETVNLLQVKLLASRNLAKKEDKCSLKKAEPMKRHMLIDPRRLPKEAGAKNLI